MDVNGEVVSFCENSKKKMGGGEGARAWVRGEGWGCQGGWEQRSEACVKIQKKMGGGVGWGVGGVGSGGGGVQLGGGGVRVAGNRELKLL